MLGSLRPLIRTSSTTQHIKKVLRRSDCRTPRTPVKQWIDERWLLRVFPCAAAVVKSTPSYLKLHSQESRETGHCEAENFYGLNEICLAFTSATGWPLRYESGVELRQDSILMWSAPVNPGVGTAPGRLRIDLGLPDRATIEPRVDRQSAERLASSIADLLGQLLAARQTIWRREAELAAGVPVVARADEPSLLAARLQAILRAGAEACDCQAAALYMLDEATTELKLRASWGLPLERLLESPRPLEGAIADLEALLGHAVTLERAASFGPWRVPEEFAAALCVPVSSPTVPLGTLWFFADHERDFTDTHTNIAEMTTGRLAAELERVMLLAAQVELVDSTRQLDAARRLQQSHLPQAIRLEEGDELAGWAASVQEVGGTFYDWFWLSDGTMALAIGSAGQAGIAGAMTVAAIRSAIRAYGEQSLSPETLLTRLNRSLWCTSGGDESVDLFYGILDLSIGRLRFSWAGRPSALRVSAGEHELVTAATTPLGVRANAEFALQMSELALDGAIVASSRSVFAADDGETADRSAWKMPLARILQDNREQPAEALVALLRESFEAGAVGEAKIDRAVVVVKRRGGG
jgi:phosphoserine phosphatase RsbU/P